LDFLEFTINERLWREKLCKSSKQQKHGLDRKLLAQGMEVVSNGFFSGQFFITWQQKELSATHTKYLCESIFCAPKNAPKLPEFEEYFI
jgi:hypothetical protein